MSSSRTTCGIFIDFVVESYSQYYSNFQTLFQLYGTPFRVISLPQSIPPRILGVGKGTNERTISCMTSKLFTDVERNSIPGAVQLHQKSSLDTLRRFLVKACTTAPPAKHPRGLVTILSVS